MSTRKGATTRARPQKHQNRTAFKNDLHDKSVKLKVINSIQVSGVCNRCKDILEWKIKYKKYKPITTPGKCVKCEQRNVKNAYHVMCRDCAKAANVCAKCLKQEEVIEVPIKSTPTEDAEMQAIIKSLPERKRRTLLRYLNKKQKTAKNETGEGDGNEEEARILEKIEKLKLSAINKGDDESFDFSSGSEDEISDDDDDEDD